VLHEIAADDGAENDNNPDDCEHDLLGKNRRWRRKEKLRSAAMAKWAAKPEGRTACPVSPACC